MLGFRPRSSHIERVLFDEEAGDLFVWFRRSGKYVYHGVPRAVFELFCKASSAGAFFNERIKGKFAGGKERLRSWHEPHFG